MSEVEMLYGNEPYCVWYHKSETVKHLTLPEFNYGVFSEFSEEAQEYALAAPMMADEKLVCFQVSDLKVLDTDGFREFIKNPPCNILIVPEYADRRTKFFKSLPLHACDKLKDSAALSKMIMRFLDGAQINQEAMDELINRLNYFDREDIDLFAVRSVCQVLSAYTDKITKEVVELLVERNDKDNAFALINYVHDGKIKPFRVQEELFNRQGMSSIAALSAMLREYRLAYKQVVLHKTSAEMGVKFGAKLKHLEKEQIISSMEIITDIIAGIKSGRYNDGNALSLAYAKLTEGQIIA